MILNELMIVHMDEEAYVCRVADNGEVTLARASNLREWCVQAFEGTACDVAQIPEEGREDDLRAIALQQLAKTPLKLESDDVLGSVTIQDGQVIATYRTKTGASIESATCTSIDDAVHWMLNQLHNETLSCHLYAILFSLRFWITGHFPRIDEDSTLR